MNSTRNVLTLSPLPILLECDAVLRLNMLVTLTRSLSIELLPLPLILEICRGTFGRSSGAIVSGSSVYGFVRMVDRPESSLDLGNSRSDVFIGFGRRGVMVLVDCCTPFEAIRLVFEISSRATGITSKNGWCNAILTQPFHVGSEGMNCSTSSSN